MSTRNIECELDIAADIETVWEAITRAEHIRHWFAPYADSQAGEGGFISLSWSDPETPMRLDIASWEENAHLGTSWHAGPAGSDPINLPLDIYLEPTAAGTRLKLVHSGFLSDESWDDEFASHSRGWNTELRHLRYYLEEQFGRARSFLRERIPLDDLAQVIGIDGVFLADIGQLREGDHFSLCVRTREGVEEMKCRLLWQLATTDFVFICDALQGGVVRLSIENFSGTPELWFWAFSYSLTEEQLVKKAGSWFQAVADRVK